MIQDEQNNLQDNIIIDEASTSYVISNILAEYNLKETDEKLTQKFFGNKGESNGGTIFWIASKLNNKEKTEKESLSALAEKLHISQKIAEQIIEDIKKNLLPALKLKGGTKEENENIERSKKPQKRENGILSQNIKKTIKNTSSEKWSNVKKQPDTYREPIE